jgi:hypothetical protein
MGSMERRDPEALRLCHITIIVRNPAAKPQQFTKRPVQAASYRIGVSALAHEARHVANLRAHKIYQRAPAHLIIHVPKPAGYVVNVIDEPWLDCPADRT